MFAEKSAIRVHFEQAAGALGRMEEVSPDRKCPLIVGALSVKSNVNVFLESESLADKPFVLFFASTCTTFKCVFFVAIAFFFVLFNLHNFKKTSIMHLG